MAATSGGAYELRRIDESSFIENDGLAAVQSTEQRALRYSEAARALDVETARAGLLDESESKGAGHVFRGDGTDLVSVETHGRPDGKLPDVQRKGKPVPSRVRDRLESIGPIIRPPDHELLGPPLETERPKETRETEIVICMEVSDEDLLERKPHTVSHHLTLRALPAVEQIEVALALHRQRGDVSTNGRTGGRGPQERDT
jgi:hypothetical protein